MKVTGAARSRRLLVEAAGKALLTGGGSFEVQQVAKRAGLSVGLAYHRFGSKAGLIGAVVHDVYDRLLQAIEIEEWAAGDWAGRERERTRRFVSFAYDNPLATIVFSKLASEPEVVTVMTARWNDVVDEGAHNIAQAQRLGMIPEGVDPQLLSALVNGAVRHAVAQALSTDPRPDRDVLTDQVWTFIEGGLGIK